MLMIDRIKSVVFKESLGHETQEEAAAAQGFALSLKL